MIPKIIHQIWGGKNPLPDMCTQLGNTWKEHHPQWQYEFWDDARMIQFVSDHFPEFSDAYSHFKYDIQRWDVIRYLILYQTGGLYVDFDSECLESVDSYIDGEGKCYFSMEPDDHCLHFYKYDCINNAFIASHPGHPFLKKIIDHIFIDSQYSYTDNKVRDVHATTGPVMLTSLYQTYSNKHEIVLLPAALVSPWSKTEVIDFQNGTADESILEKKLEKAIAIHYFFSLWA